MKAAQLLTWSSVRKDKGYSYGKATRNENFNKVKWNSIKTSKQISWRTYHSRHKMHTGNQEENRNSNILRCPNRNLFADIMERFIGGKNQREDLKQCGLMTSKNGPTLENMSS